MSKYRKEMNYLKYLCERDKLPKELEETATSILLIETYYRNLFFRIIEYIVVYSFGLLSILTRIPIKNYTIGVSQIGISYILNYNGFQIYEHIEYIEHLNLAMFKSIIDAFNYKRNIEVSLYRITKYYNTLNISSKDRLVARRIGEKYNGTYEYGLLVEKINHELNNLVIGTSF